jgi:glycosyltransferase involved in cell wall biosynthesis
MALPKILLAHPGTQHSHKLAKQLAQRNMLYKFVTGLAIKEKGFLHTAVKMLPSKIKKQLSNRVIADVPSSRLKTFPLAEIKSIAGAKKVTNKEQALFERNETFQQKVPVSFIKHSDVVIGFDTSALTLAKRAKAQDKKFILDVSIAHSASKNQVYKNISANFPSWKFALEEKPVELLVIEQQEYEIADAIVVAGSFTKQTLIDNGVPEQKIQVNPYGIDINKFSAKKDYKHNGTIRFLFVGLIDARKGIPLLMDTIREMDTSKASFTLVGAVDEKATALINAYQLPNVKFAGKVPHAQVNTVFTEHDVFVFPSYFEGFGLVILEAMASGLPVIVTDATAGEDCVEDSKEGFIIKAGDKEGLAKSIHYFIDHPEQVEPIGRAARKRAEQFTWDAYGDRWQAIIEKVLEQKN